MKNWWRGMVAYWWYFSEANVHTRKAILNMDIALWFNVMGSPQMDFETKRTIEVVAPWAARKLMRHLRKKGYEVKPIYFQEKPNRDGMYLYTLRIRWRPNIWCQQ